MPAKDIYNSMISKIEELIRGNDNNGIVEYYDDQEILSNIKEKYLVSFGITNDREINGIFKLTHGVPVISYISERKMMAAYKALCEGTNWDSSKNMAISISGLGDQPAFDKKFKRIFDIVPRRVFDEKDISIYVEPVWWDDLSEDGKEGFEFAAEEEYKEPESRFGISAEIYSIAQKAEELQAGYNLSNREADLAYALYRDDEMTMSDAFNYVYKYVDEIGNDDTKLEKFLSDKDVIYLYKEFKYSFSRIHCIILAYRFGNMNESIRDLSKDYISGLVTYCEDKSIPGEEDKTWLLDDGIYMELINEYNELYQYYAENKTETHNKQDYIIYVRACRFSSREILYPDYMYIFSQIEPGNTGINIPKQLVTYYINERRELENMDDLYDESETEDFNDEELGHDEFLY